MVEGWGREAGSHGCYPQPSGGDGGRCVWCVVVRRALCGRDLDDDIVDAGSPRQSEEFVERPRAMNEAVEAVRPSTPRAQARAMVTREVLVSCEPVISRRSPGRGGGHRGPENTKSRERSSPPAAGEGRSDALVVPGSWVVGLCRSGSWGSVWKKGRRVRHAPAFPDSPRRFRRGSLRRKYV